MGISVLKDNHLPAVLEQIWK